MSEILLDTPWIRCPECGKVFRGEITWEEGDPWPGYINICPFCGYTIMESEFEEAEHE